MKLTQQNWDAMSNAERLEYLNSGGLEVRKQHGIDGRAKVGEAQVLTSYSVIMNGVTLGVNRSLPAALRTTAEYLETLEQ